MQIILYIFSKQNIEEKTWEIILLELPLITYLTIFPWSILISEIISSFVNNFVILYFSQLIMNILIYFQPQLFNKSSSCHFININPMRYTFITVQKFSSY